MRGEKKRKMSANQVGVDFVDGAGNLSAPCLLNTTVNIPPAVATMPSNLDHICGRYQG